MENKPFGWVIVDKDGVEVTYKSRLSYFFGSIIEVEEYTPECIAHLERHWPGLAPMKVIELWTK